MTRSRAAMIAGWFCCGIALISLTGFGNFAGFNARLRLLGEQRRGECVFPGLHHDNAGNLLSWVRRRQHTLLAVGLASACVWLFHYLIARGVRQAAAVNWIVTIAKLVPIVVFIIVVGFAFDPRRSRPTSGAVSHNPRSPYLIKSRTRCW
jgi:arginine:ornithine antiporter/lysine permease